MKKAHIISFILALTFLVSCGEKIEESSQSTSIDSAGPSSEIAAESESSSDPLPEPEPSESSVSEESSSEESEELIPIPTPDIIPDDFVIGTPANNDWEYMMPADMILQSYTPVSVAAEHRCFTVLNDGKWGLIDESGNWLLPCAADQPVVKCNLGHWIFRVDGWIPDNDELYTFSEQLKERELAPLCDGHGGDSSHYFVNTDSDSTIPMVFATVEGCIDFVKIPADELTAMDYAPAYFAGLEMTDLGEEPASNGYWNFVNGEGDVLIPDKQFYLVGSFGGEELAPVIILDKWAYINRNGELVTDFVYDSCWYMQYEYSTEEDWHAVFPTFAYCLSGGCAPVLRDGKWGVIDSTGTEVVPCEYEGAAPLPGGAWLKKDGKWEKWTMN